MCRQWQQKAGQYYNAPRDSTIVLSRHAPNRTELRLGSGRPWQLFVTSSSADRPGHSHISVARLHVYNINNIYTTSRYKVHRSQSTTLPAYNLRLNIFFESDHKQFTFSLFAIISTIYSRLYQSFLDSRNTCA